MHEVVLDANVLVAGLRPERGASFQLIRSLGQGGWRANISEASALECENILKRNGLLPGLGETDTGLFKASNLVPFVLRRGRIATRQNSPVDLDSGQPYNPPTNPMSRGGAKCGL